MTKTDKIKQAVTDYVKGGDERNTELLNEVLHEDFRLANNGSNNIGVSVMDKERYPSLIKEKVYGGSPREMNNERIEEISNIAAVKLSLKSATLVFTSFVSLVLNENNEWEIINNLTFTIPSK